MKRENELSSTNESRTLPNECLFRLNVSSGYILHSTINEIPLPKLAVSLSTDEISLYDVESQTNVIKFTSHDNSVTGIKFSQENPDLLFSSSLDGRILLWDLRKGIQPASSYYDDCDASIKPLTCFDYNAEEKYLCGGTEVIREDSFLIFWDRRMTKPLGGYWESHYEDISQVHFHSTLDSSLASSSVDGIINLFNLTESSEDDALENTLKINSSVNKFCWVKSDIVSCITSNDEYQFWFTSEVRPSVIMNKMQLSEDFMCDIDYLIDTFKVDNQIFLATGNNEGSLQLYKCNKKGLKIICEVRNGHTDIIRTISHSDKNKYLATGGEDGVLCIWRSPIK